MFGTATEHPDLDDWPTVSLDRMGVREVAGDEFAELVAHGAPAGSVHSVETAPGGSVAARIAGTTHTPGSEECGIVLAQYLNKSPFGWDPERVVLLNQPCYITVATGAVLLADGRVVSETLFPTRSGTLEFRVGGGLSAENLTEKMRTARVLAEGVWAPLLSRGSSVYGHAIAESMVQNSVLQRAGLSPLISYVATSWPSPAQEIVLADAHSPVARARSQLVKVPRVIFASKLYRHLPVGNELRYCLNGIRDRICSSFGANEPHRNKVYLSRLNASNRRMTDEAELIERLVKQGFRIVECERLTFAEQVHAVQGAGLIVGAYGSQLTNAAFAAPDAVLCELRSLNNPDNSPNLDDFYMALTAAMGQAYAVRMVANPPGADSWQCDVAETLDFIAELSPGPVHPRSHRPAAEPAVPDAGDAGRPHAGAVSWSIPDHAGEDFFSLLGRLHGSLRPTNYFEVGTGGGSTLALAACASIAVDPNMAVSLDVMANKPACFLFRMDGPRFFERYDTRALIGEPIALALLLDQHFFEDILHDFLQLERRMTARSVILVHNCLPTDAHVARRLAEDQTLAHASRHPEWWTGDVWKALAVLRRFRPELSIRAFNAYPTGLAMITNLDPGSDVLARHHQDIIAEYKTLDLAEYGIEQYLHELDACDAEMLSLSR